MNIDDLKVYELSMELGDKIWSIVIKWDNFEKETIGKQLVRAVDSIAANLSEGFGCYQYKEKKNFSYYSRGSLYESKTWIVKAKNRELINENEFEDFKKDINFIGKMLNSYIKTIGNEKKNNINEINEPDIEYGDEIDTIFTND
jgi:four helix bundle protein